MTSEAKQGFKSKIEQITSHSGCTYRNEEMEPEKIESLDPQSDFHKFLCDFCVSHALFLSPVTMLGEDDRKFYGDPVFIEHMTVGLNERDKADRYVTFLNEIKQEYILGRYFLVQSQFSIPELDVVDEGVLLVYPLDYSLHSVYIQLLKASLKQAISVLDKVAYFLYDYCKMKTPASDKVSFLQIWGGGDRLPKQLRSFENPYLLALFYLARDVAKSGEWNFIYQHRNALTHRFLVLHDMDLGQQQANSDIPRAQEDNFTNQVIFATKLHVQR
ncbi:hypothetical protein HC928_03970 [bacterium]|nr:hypothetical protein [bacterium]